MRPAPTRFPPAATGRRISASRLFDNENREPTVFRSKAVGEPPLMLGISVFRALSDAIASLADYRLLPALDAPATPERVLLAIEELRARQVSRAPEREAGAAPRLGGRIAMSDWLDKRDQRCSKPARPCVLVTIVDAEGSTPREAGAKMLVHAGGIADSIGGGHLELKAIEQARAMLDYRCSARHHAYALGPSLGQCCGGRVRLMLERLDHGVARLASPLAGKAAAICWSPISPMAPSRIERNEHAPAGEPMRLLDRGAGRAMLCSASA